MTINILTRFLEEHIYDIRITGNGRWIDQKCALDAVCFVADCIGDYIQKGGTQPFQSTDIWRSDYAISNVQAWFGKPDPLKRSTLDEYNKFFRQPMKMLAAAGVLKEDGVVRNAIQFSIANNDILEFVAQRERNTFDFLCLYIEKTLRDSGLWDSFESFFDEQTKERFDFLKSNFANFCIKYTPINTTVEANRIFIKVLNPLACKLHKKGTERGRISSSIITYNKIMYNRPNWRDVLIGKDKNVARGDFRIPATNDSQYQYRISKAKRLLRQFNDKFNRGKSEIIDKFSIGEKATHMHHIFPKNEYEIIAHYIENLIALTSGQHLQKAHPNGNTQIVDKGYQYLCLISKIESIRKNLLENDGETIIYSFEDFMFILDIGLNTNYFENLPLNDFNSVVTGVDFNFSNR